MPEDPRIGAGLVCQMMCGYPYNGGLPPGKTPSPDRLPGEPRLTNFCRRSGEWNALEIRVTLPARPGGEARVTTLVNGETVVADFSFSHGTGASYKKPTQPTDALYLQAHWGSKVQFRNPRVVREECAGGST